MQTKQLTRHHGHAADSNANDGFEIDPLPSTMETTGPKLVYLYLQVVEETTIDDLAGTLGMKMLTLYPMLGTLKDEGLIEQDGETFALAF